MTLEQLFLQLGICGAMLLVWFRIETKRIDRNAAVEDKKTDAMTAGFQSIGLKIDSHHTADIQSHGALATDISEIRGMLTERHEAPRTQTPARGIPIREVVRARSHGDR